MGSKWEPRKEQIKELFLNQRLTLNEVMGVMKSDGFSASKKSYERQLNMWGFKKNFKHADLKIIKARYANIVQQKVRFGIRISGNRADGRQLKKIDRCFIPSSEKYRLERSRLPEEWAITPHVSKPYLSSVTTKLLPWEGFQIQFDSFANTIGFFDMPLQMRELVIPTLRREASSQLCNHHSNLIENIFHNLSAVLPVAEDAGICNILWQVIGLDSSTATAQFLKLAIYFLSNKLFDYNLRLLFQVNDELLKWFKIGNNHRLLKAILSSRTPTIDALAEGLFYSALRAEDRAFSRIFLELGLNPDIILEYKEYDEKLRYDHRLWYTPLQMMVQRSNICMIELLFEFDADVNANGNYSSNLHQIESRPVTTYSALLLATKVSNLEIARLLLSKGAWVNSSAERSQTPLQSALGAGDIKMVRLLLDAAADVNLSGGGGVFAECPLWYAITSGKRTLVDMLLERGAKLDPRDANRIGTQLQRAIRMKDETEIRRLLELGADVNAPAGEWDGRTALQEAAGKGDLALCRVLIRAGADVNAAAAAPAAAVTPFHSSVFSRTHGVTALVAALSSQNHQLVRFLVDSKADVNAMISGQLDGKYTALTVAVSLDDVEMVLYLISVGADAAQDNSILVGALRGRWEELIPVLISAGANINHQDTDMSGFSLLDNVARKRDSGFIQFLLNCGARPGYKSLSEAASNGNYHTVQLLIKAGADPNNCGLGTESALEAAARHGHVNVVTYLLDKGADVNGSACGMGRSTALQVAVGFGDMNLIRLLVTREADVNAPAARWGQTALQAAVERMDELLVRWLLEAGANVNDESNFGYNSLQEAAAKGADNLIPILLRHGARINTQPRCATVLQAAAENGHYSTVQLLLSKGAHVNTLIPDASSCNNISTALQAAARGGYIRIAEALINANADIDTRGTGKFGRTALELAAKYGRIDMLKLLLNAGANIATGDGRLQLRNALKYARKRGHDAAAKYLECHQISEGI